MIGSDLVGYGALIGAMAAAIVSIITAWRTTAVKAVVEKVHEAVVVSNGHTIGEMIEANQERHDAQDKAS